MKRFYNKEILAPLILFDGICKGETLNRNKRRIAICFTGPYYINGEMVKDPDRLIRQECPR